MSKELSYWLAFDCLKVGIGRQKIEKLHQHFGNLSEAWKASKEELLALKFPEKTIDRFIEKREQIDPAAKLAIIEEKQIQVHRYLDSTYPDDLNLLSNQPTIIYTKGLWDKNCFKKSVAIVGTREPTEYAFFMTQQISYELSKQGFAIVSGMALGVDTAAHLGATSAQVLQENKITSVAVLPGGIDQIIPYKNKQIYQVLEKKGCLLSEHFPGTKPEIGFFPLRNRIVAALSQAVLVTEAPEKSGSLITAKEALKINKAIFGLAGRADNKKNSGLYQFFREYSKESKIVSSAEDIVKELTSSGDKVKTSTISKEKQQIQKVEVEQVTKVNTEKLILSPEEEKLYHFLSSAPERSARVDQLIENLKLPISKINTLLLKLRLKSLIKESNSGKVSLL